MAKRWKCLLLVLMIAAIIKWRREVFDIAVVFAYAGGFTIILAPLCKAIEKKGVSAAKAAGLSVLCFLMLLAALFSVFVPCLVSQSVELFQKTMPVMRELVSNGMNWTPVRWILKGIQTGEQSGLTAGTFISVLTKAGTVFAAQTGRIVFALVMTYYFLRERKALSMKLLLCVPLARRRALLFLLSGCRNDVLGYLSGMVKTSVFISAATFAGLLLLDVNNAFLLALLMGIMEFLPYVGPVLAAIPILLSCLTYGTEKALLALGLVVLVQQLESNFVGPYFTASSTSLYPLTALISVFVLGKLAGIWGIVLAVPLAVILKSVIWSVQQYRYRKA